MKPGRYLRLRREAGGCGIDDTPLCGDRLTEIEGGSAPMDIELWALKNFFRFDVEVLVALGRGIIPDICRICGCTDYDPCMTGDPCYGCCWVEADLCSACADEARALPEGLAA
ncbi:MAG: XRE family transcriptional regulator [Sphingomicrobium sp.]